MYRNLARRCSGSPVRIVLLDTTPGKPDPSWEDVVEVSITVPEASNVRWCSWAGENVGTIDGLGAGTYRMRVSARGRDAGHASEFAEEPVDFYMAQLWLTSEEPDAALRVSSSDAAYWHAAVGCRPARA